MKNNQLVINKINKLYQKTNIDKNIILKFYIYERFLERLSLSRYKDNFILKGGFYLSSILGLNTRTTKDIDTCLKGQTLSKDNLLKIITEIINIDLDDNVIISLNKIEPIKVNDIYNGYSVIVDIKILNIKDKIYIDVATGDKVTPKEVVYKYKTLIDNKEINLLAYNLETVIAEKLHSILSKGETTSRMKDYYDIYLIKNLLWDKVNINLLREAIINTFEFRCSLEIFNQASEIIENLEDSVILKNYWISYQRKNNINVLYKQTILDLKEIIEIASPVTV